MLNIFNMMQLLVKQVRLTKENNKVIFWQGSLMSKTLLACALLVSPALLAYTTVEEISLSANGIRTLDIRTYSGPLTISRSDSDDIEVQAVIEFTDEWEDDEAREALDDALFFDLEKRGSQAQLDSWVGDYDEGDFSFFTWGLIDFFRSGKDRPDIYLEVKLPPGLEVEINDYRGEVIIDHVIADISLRTGSGPVEIFELEGDLDLEDGSGEIDIDGVTGDVEIRDGSGNIDVQNIGGRLTIHDGSGNIEVRTVGDLLDIRDGSGNIRVNDLHADSEIIDGSGDIDVRSVAGNLSLSDGSGSINVTNVEKDVIVFNRGSGGFNVRGVQGEVHDSSSQNGDRRRYGNNEDRYRDRSNFKEFEEFEDFEEFEEFGER